MVAAVLATTVEGCKQSSAPDYSQVAAGTNLAVQSAGINFSNAWQNTKQAGGNAWNGVKSSVQSATDYTYDHKDAFLAAARTNLANLDQQLQEWSDKAVNAVDSAKADAQAKLQDLRAQRAKLDGVFQSVENSTDANWSEVKAGFKDSYDTMTNSVGQAWQWLNAKLGF